MDTITAIIVVTILYTLLGGLCASLVRALGAETIIVTRKWEARWLLLCIVWPLIPVIGVFWVIAVIVYWIWESLANLIHDAQLGKRN